MLTKTDFETIGSLKINDITWSAVAENQEEIKENEIVEVVKISGNKLIVKKVVSEEQKPKKEKVDVAETKNDNIDFNFLSNPIAYIGQDSVNEVECIKMRLEEVSGGRARPIVIENSNYIIKADCKGDYKESSGYEHDYFAH